MIDGADLLSSSAAQKNKTFASETQEILKVFGAAYAVALTFAAAVGMTAGQTIIYPDTAQAGVVSSIKGAAKKVGRTAKTTAPKALARLPRQAARSESRSASGLAAT